MFFASARVHRINTQGYLETQRAHALREGKHRASVRPEAVPGAGWALSPVVPEEPRDYVKAFAAVPDHFNVRYRKNAPFGLHLLLNVSPAWIEEAGELHAEENPRNKLLYQAAQDFVRDIPGFVAARMDLDEEGGGVVDIFLAPVFPRTSRVRGNGERGPEIPEISVSKLDTLWRERTGERVAYSGLQTLWADYCQKELDTRIQRGYRKSETGREHLSVPEFKEQAERAAAMVAAAEQMMSRARQIEAEALKKHNDIEQERVLLHADMIMFEDARNLEEAIANERESKLVNDQAALDRQRTQMDEEYQRFNRTREEFRRRQEELDEKERSIREDEARIAQMKAELADRERKHEEEQTRWRVQAGNARVVRESQHLAQELKLESARLKIEDEQRRLAQLSQELDDQRQSQNRFSEIMEAGVERIRNGKIRSRDALDTSPDLRSVVGPLTLIFDCFQSFGQAEQQRNAECKAASEERAELAAEREKVSHLLDTLSAAIGDIAPIQTLLTPEYRRRLENARQAQVRARRSRGDDGPGL